MISTKYDSVRKLWSGADDPSALFHENVTIGRAVLYLLNLNPAKICQVSADDGSTRTNGEIYQATLNIALNLQKRGCSKGDVVGFVCRNSHNLTPAFLAAQFLGAPTNAVDVAFSKGISQAAVVGIPDPVFTDLPAAVVVQRNGTSVTEEELLKLVEKSVPDYKKLRGGVYFVDDFPMTPSGKIRKPKVKELAISLYNAKQAHKL
uniref:AMP-binding enzyme C-terminal domain-containing protein n=1 Tax=Lutzomyia longipalpis TaxID=7200 RepID=A0A1B0GIH5_LUTLO